MTSTSLRLSLLSLFLMIGQAPFLAAQEWSTLTSKDGKITALVPGKPQERVVKTKSLAGEMVSYDKVYETDSVHFNLSRTDLPPKVVKFAGKNTIYKNTKGKLLEKAMGKETSFKDFEVDGVTCKLLEYDLVHHSDPNHQGFKGYTLMLVLDNSLYVANGVVMKDGGMEDLEKFGQSIKIKK